MISYHIKLTDGTCHNCIMLNSNGSKVTPVHYFTKYVNKC